MDFGGACRTGSVRCITPGGQTLITGGNDKIVCFWDLVTDERKLEFEWHTRAVRSLAISSDNRILASADAGGVVRLWLAADNF